MLNDLGYTERDLTILKHYILKQPEAIWLWCSIIFCLWYHNTIRYVYRVKTWNISSFEVGEIGFTWGDDLEVSEIGFTWEGGDLEVGEIWIHLRRWRPPSMKSYITYFVCWALERHGNVEQNISCSMNIYITVPRHSIKDTSIVIDQLPSQPHNQILTSVSKPIIYRMLIHKTDE